MPIIIMKTTNIVHVTGRISHIQNGVDNKSRSYFFVESYTKGRGTRLKMSYADLMPDNIKNGDTVEVKGYVATVRKLNAESGRVDNLTFINVTSIEKKKSEMEKAFKKPGFFHSGDEVKALFSGTITNVITTKSSDWMKLVIMVDEDRIDRYPANIVLDCFMNKSKKGTKIPDDVKKGDIAYCVCSIVSAQKKIDEKWIHFQNFKVEDLVIEGNRFTEKEETNSEVEAE